MLRAVSLSNGRVEPDGRATEMRISIQGECDAAKVVAGYLRSQGYLVTDTAPNYTVHLDEAATPVVDGQRAIVVDGIDCRLESRMVWHITQLSKTRIVLARAGGVQSDQEIRIVFPPEEALAVERGVFRGVLDAVLPQEEAATGKATKKEAHKPWWRRLLA